MASEPLDWQMQCKELKQRCAYLFHNGLWSDCSFLVGSEPDQACVPGHKLILAMASPVFEAKFYGGMAQGNNELIPILDVQPDAFKAMLEYIYTDNINISSIDMAGDLYYGGKKYMLPHLVEECTRFLLAALNPTNACRAYEFARLFEEKALMEQCLQIIRTQTKEVLADSSFEDVELDTMVMVFSLEELNVDSELELCEAAVRYAHAQATRQAERPPSAEPTAYEKVLVELKGRIAEPRRAEPGPGPSSPDRRPESPEKLTIRSAIEKIRFLTLTPEQFLEGPDAAQPPLLTMSEAYAVLKHIILPNNPTVPLPQGFSTSRVPRKLVPTTFRTPNDWENPSETQMRRDRAWYRATFSFTLTNVRNRHHTVFSPPFYARNLPWKIVARLPPPDSQEKYLGFFLHCGGDSVSSSWSCYAKAYLTLISHNKTDLSDLSFVWFDERIDCRLFNSKANTAGFSHFLAWDDVLDPEKGYVKDDAITLHVTVETSDSEICDIILESARKIICLNLRDPN